MVMNVRFTFCHSDNNRYTFGHRFEKYTLESKTHKNVDIVLVIKNVFKLEGVINL